MTDPVNLTDPIAALLAVVRALRQGGIDSAVYGGLALAAYGEPRETKDADLAVVGVGGPEGMRALKAAGMEVALAFDRVRFGGNLVTRITLLEDERHTGLNVADLVEPRSTRFAKLALARATTAELRGEPVRLLSPEDFVLFKLLSTRERDLEDAAAVVRSIGTRLDFSAVEAEAARLAQEIPDHQVAGRLVKLKELALGGPPG